MQQASLNQRLAENTLQWIARLGVREICICPGARNAPFVELLEKITGLLVYPFFEERSAAFFALGLIKRFDRPVAVCTTSGTACAELFPAIIEGFYAGLPLIALTCDRPRRLRGSGAPQSIDQVNLFGSYVTQCFDIEGEAELSTIVNQPHTRPQIPMHINICLDEPLSGGSNPTFSLSDIESVEESPLNTTVESASDALKDFLGQVKSPLVILGPLSSADREPVGQWLKKRSFPVLAEGASGLRGSAHLAKVELLCGNSSATDLLSKGVCDSVIRIGGVPTGRIWRDLDVKFTKTPVLSISRTPFLGLAHGELIEIVPAKLFAGDRLECSSRDEPDLSVDRKNASTIELLLSDYPTSEPGMVRRISRWIASEDNLYLGNSLPIREWDLAAAQDVCPAEVGVNRGVNGIDGQLSTFFGFCSPSRVNWAVVGDLTTLYDLSAPSIVNLIPETRFRIVIINNSGGQIFRRMFRSPLFQNQHKIEFRKWAEMWGLSYYRYTEIPEIPPTDVRSVIEVLPNSGATEQFWDSLAAIAA